MNTSIRSQIILLIEAKCEFQEYKKSSNINRKRRRKKIMFEWRIRTIIVCAFCLSSSVKSLDLSQCIGPLGMETGSIKDSAIRASSSFEDSTVGPQNARIRKDRNGGAWCPKSMIEKEGKEWLEIDLKSVHAISATESQGRFGNGQGVEFAEAYMLEYFRPRLNKWVRFRTREGKEVLDANSNTYLPVKNDLDPVILASKIRFHPYSHFKRTICMRVEVYGCSWQDGLISYSMPQGDRRGNAYEFYDWTYDGEWKGNQLINGLGCLTDGDYGPQNFKLSYYAQSRGWVGWRRGDSEREYVEILFEFGANREFHQVNIYTNNQFSRDVAVFKMVKVHFSVGGEIYNQDPVVHEPMEDTIFEESRNVTVKLHRRVAKYIKVQLYFASKWIMISEVSFDSTVARGNYTDETTSAAILTEETLSANELNDEEEVSILKKSELDDDDKNSDGRSSSSKVDSDTPSTSHADDSAYMPVLVGVLATVIVLLAAIIFFIVSRSKRQKKGQHVSQEGCLTNDLLGSDEKMALNNVSYPINYPPNGFILTNSSDTGSSGHSGRMMPKLDDNYNTPHHPMLTPRQMRAQLYSTNRNGSVQSQITPKTGRKGTFLPPVPRLQVPPPPPGGPPPIPQQEALYTEPNNYTEPYRSMRYYGYGPALSEMEDSLMKQSLLSDTSCDRDYAVPLPRNNQIVNSSVRPLQAGAAGKKKHSRDVDSITSSMERNGYNSMHENEDEQRDLKKPNSPSNSHCSDSLKAMRDRLKTHVVPELTGNQLSLGQRLSEGSFGTVYIADAHGLPEYGGRVNSDQMLGVNCAAEDPSSSKYKRLVAVKFLSEDASEEEKQEFIREVKLLSVLEDVNISRVLGMCSTQDPYLVAMEYLEHGDLNQFLRCHLPEGTNPLPPGTRSLSLGTLIHMASQVASGMRYLESLNFVHRDLATRNCLVGKAYHLKICDFGSDNPVYARDYFEMDSHLLIPLRWMAWESVVMCKYTTKSDVWSFGVCLWEILQLASVRPYSNLSDQEIVLELAQTQQQQTRTTKLKLEKPSVCPKDLYELMSECWKREPMARPSFREIHLFLQRKNLGYSPL